MAKVIKMPVLGNSVEEVRILQWFKQEGDTVAAGERLLEVETDKTSMEWESPESGVVRAILTPADAYVRVEAPIVIIGTADEPIDGLSGGDAPAPVASPPVSDTPAPSTPTPAMPAPTPGTRSSIPSAAILSPRAQRTAAELGVDHSLLAGRGTGPRGRVQEKDVLTLHAELEAAANVAADMAGRSPKASPLARAVASDAGLDLAAVTGSGTGGRITADDVRAASPAPAVTVPTPNTQHLTPSTATTTVAITGLRKRVADNLMRSVREKPHVTLNLSADMTGAIQLRKDLLPIIEKKTGVRLSPTDIIAKASAVALTEFPYINAHIEGDSMTLFAEVNVGLAVSLGDEGLIVPVIRDVARKGLAQIAADRHELVERARSGKLGSADITGGTFTVTNLGNYGIEAFNPIIPPPQVAILGVGAIADTVVARNGAPTVRPMMGLSLSFDHRAVDGAPAAAFLARLKEILETPTLLLV